MKACLLLLFLAQPVLAQTLNRDLPLTAATFLGGQSDDSVVAVAIVGGSLVVAGNFSDPYAPAGVTPVALGPGPGALVFLNIDGTMATAMTRLDGLVRHMAASADAIVVALDTGLVVVAPDGAALAEAPLNVDATRVDVNAAGQFAALGAGNVVAVFDAGAVEVGRRTFGEFTRLDDVAVTPAGDVVVTGYNQLNANLKSPVLVCYDATLTTQRWEAYGFSNTQVTGANLGADSEGERVAVGADGNLYFSGATDGGNTVFQRRPDNINANLGVLIQTDNFTRPVSLSGSAKFSFHARLDPVTGAMSAAQFLLARLSSGRQNTCRIREITADAAGNVIAVGRAFADIEGRDESNVAGQAVGGYAGGNLFALVVSADYQNRLYWTSFNGANPGQSEGFATAAQGDVTQLSGVLVLAGDVFDAANDSMILTNAIQATPMGQHDLYLAATGSSYGALLAAWPNQVTILDLLRR